MRLRAIGSRYDITRAILRTYCQLGVLREQTDSGDGLWIRQENGAYRFKPEAADWVVLARRLQLNGLREYTDLRRLLWRYHDEGGLPIDILAQLFDENSNYDAFVKALVTATGKDLANP
jgi:hypothetical protein